MLKISIICLDFEEESIRNACSLLPNWELQIEIVREPNPTLVLESSVSFFFSLASFAAYTKHQPSPTLYIHPDLAILQITQDISLSKDLYDNGLRPCCLSGDFDQDIVPDIPNLHIFADFAHFIRSKQHSDILVTQNHNLILSLLIQDESLWEIIHPSQKARNLAIDIFGEKMVLPRLLTVLQQLESKADTVADNFYLPALRHYVKAPHNSYSFFAEHYDDYMAHVDYDLWVTRLLSWYQTYTKNPLQNVLELACGTANISTRLVLKGFHVDACDISYDMLRIAAHKSLKPNLYQASLTDSIPKHDYQLIVCMFDSVNYLLKSSQISQMLAEVYKALAEGGLFIFDISTLYNSEENFADICSMQRSKDGYLVHQSWFETIQLKQKSSLHYFKKSVLSYQHSFEEHTQRVYYCAEMIELISNSSLKLVAIHTTESKTNYYPRLISCIDDKFPRLFFILKKEEL